MLSGCPCLARQIKEPAPLPSAVLVNDCIVGGRTKVHRPKKNNNSPSVHSLNCTTKHLAMLDKVVPKTLDADILTCVSFLSRKHSWSPPPSGWRMWLLT